MHCKKNTFNIIYEITADVQSQPGQHKHEGRALNSTCGCLLESNSAFAGEGSHQQNCWGLQILVHCSPPELITAEQLTCFGIALVVVIPFNVFL